MNRRRHRKKLGSGVLLLCNRYRRQLVFLLLALLMFGVVMLRPANADYQLPNPDTLAMGQPLANTALYADTDDSAAISRSRNVDALLLLGQQNYEAGQLVAALQNWKSAVENAPNPLKQALGLSYVSLAAQDLGDWAQAEEAITRSFALLADSQGGAESVKVQAQILNMQGRLQLKQGKPESAWETWQETERFYARTDDFLGSIGAQINQAQALQTMGLYRRARVKLMDITTALEKQPDVKVKAIALQSLGNVLQTSGSLEQSQKHLAESIRLYEQLDDQSEALVVLSSLANTQRLMGDTDAALQSYRTVEDRSNQLLVRSKASLNRLSLLLDSKQWKPAKELLPDIYLAVQSLPDGREAIFHKVNLIESLLSNSGEEQQPIRWLSVEKAVTLLKEAHQQAQLLRDERSQSLVMGELAKVYSYVQRWSDAQILAEKALSVSQNIAAQDLSYRWQQQLGKAYIAQGKKEDAIASYSDAVNTLGYVRRDLLVTNADVQYSFRKTVEPVYRELVSLLLLDDEISQANLLKAREVIEDLQLAELENYFKSACVDSASEYIDKLDSEAAVLYPIVLSNRVEVILSLPGGELKHYRTWQSNETTNQVISDLFRNFNPALSSRKRLSLSKQIYDWLIEPAEVDLASSQVKTLVFVLDGKFRNIPMAALYDGDRYLLEKYSVALTPGLKLLGPHFQNPKPLQALMMGLTEARGGFSALPGVKDEIEQVATRVSAEVLFNQDFTKEKLESEIDRVPFPVLHLATHGQFSSDLNKTFLLAWDEKITLSDLDGLLRSRRQQSEPIELMVLSACQTAEGDDRAALGLAGMAIRSGARSTLATLWAVNDQSTAALITQFYQELSNTNLSKADALRAAQIKILQTPEFSHPFYWSPFVLIGNWLS